MGKKKNSFDEYSQKYSHRMTKNMKSEWKLSIKCLFFYDYLNNKIMNSRIVYSKGANKNETRVYWNTLWMLLRRLYTNNDYGREQEGKG